MWEKILVPLDGSNLAELALAYAEELSGAFASELVLLYVSEPKESQYRHMHRLYMEGVAKKVGERLKKRARVRTVVLTGEPAEQIIGYAEKNKVGVIIMASHGRSGILAWATGSVASKVLEAAKVPVLLIRAVKPPKKASRKKLLERILLPLDGSKLGEAAVPYVKELGEKLGAELVLFCVVEAGQHVHTVGGLDYIVYPEPEMEQFKAEARGYLERLYRRLKGRKGAVQVELGVGDDVAGEIIRFAKKAKANLIAISSHGHSGIEKWVFGSVASKIIHASKIPVLLVRSSGRKP